MGIFHFFKKHSLKHLIRLVLLQIKRENYTSTLLVDIFGKIFLTLSVFSSFFLVIYKAEDAFVAELLIIILSIFILLSQIFLPLKIPLDMHQLIYLKVSNRRVKQLIQMVNLSNPPLLLYLFFSIGISFYLNSANSIILIVCSFLFTHYSTFSIRLFSLVGNKVLFIPITSYAVFLFVAINNIGHFYSTVQYVMLILLLVSALIPTLCNLKLKKR